MHTPKHSCGSLKRAGKQLFAAGTFAIAASFPFAGTTSLLTTPAHADGRNPASELVLNPDGNFYGTTVHGGANSNGCLFKMSPTGTFVDIVDCGPFPGPNMGNPYSSPVLGDDGYLYGLMMGGSTYGNGLLYKVKSDGTGFTIVHAFTSAEPSIPIGTLLVGNDGYFYGVSEQGGASNKGTAFKINKAGTVTILHNFGGTGDGSGPDSGLMRASNGVLYGVTKSGGAYGYGSLYQVTTSGGYTLLHSFTGSELFDPNSVLVQGNDGYLYGTCLVGSSWGGGVFRATLTGTVTDIYNFSSASNEHPAAGLVFGNDGYLYGTLADNTSGFGFNIVGGNYGAIFRLATDGSTMQIIHQFPAEAANGSSTQGTCPVTSLTLGSDGLLYGTTFGDIGLLSAGTGVGYGSLFRLKRDGSAFAVLHLFQ